MAKNEKLSDKAGFDDLMEDWSSHTLWYENKMVQPLCKTVRQFIKKISIHLSYDPAIPLVGIYQGNQNICPRED